MQGCGGRYSTLRVYVLASGFYSIEWYQEEGGERSVPFPLGSANCYLSDLLAETIGQAPSHTLLLHGFTVLLQEHGKIEACM